MDMSRDTNLLNLLNVQAFLANITESTLELNPHTYIFNILPGYKNKEWEQLALLTARRCIARHWIQQDPPTVKEVEKDLTKLFRLEKMECEHNLKARSQGITKFWARWGAFNGKALSREIPDLDHIP